jgi:hypothetical protein
LRVFTREYHARFGPRKYNQKRGNKRCTRTHGGNVGHSRRQNNCRNRQRRQRKVDAKNSGHDLKDSEAAIGGALIKMRPMRLLYRFAVRGPAYERNGAVGKIIER